jgi:hypothetical protein
MVRWPRLLVTRPDDPVDWRGTAAARDWLVGSRSLGGRSRLPSREENREASRSETAPDTWRTVEAGVGALIGVAQFR